MNHRLAFVLVATILGATACSVPSENGGEASPAPPQPPPTSPAPPEQPALVPPPKKSEVPRSPKPGGDDAGLTLATANTRFALDLYAQLAAQPGNLFFSPFSISSALAMTWGGARGETAAEMARALHFDATPVATAQGFSALDSALAARGAGVELAIANRLWGQIGYDFSEEYLALGRDYFDATLATVDFINDPASARRQVNDWVAGRTRDKIQDLIPPNTFNDFTRLVLTNAIYFKGSWARQFEPSATHDAPFYVGDGVTVEVALMHQESAFRYAALDGLKILRLPYTGDEVSMLVALPEVVDGLAVIETRLNLATLNAWRAALKTTDVRVYLPRFRVSEQFLLGETLQTLGMATAFDPDRADFSGMTGHRELYISAAIHKAYAEVNEEGTEAAAATAVVMGIESVRDVPEFRADHPFLFLILHEPTDTILFIGRYADPGS